MGNSYIRVAMDNARSLQLELNTQRDAVTNKIMDIVLLRNFFTTWHDQSYEAALEGLPDDNPETPNIDESVSEDELQSLAESALGKKWEEMNTDDAEAIRENQVALQAKIRLYLGQQSDLRSRADGIEDDIANLTALQEAEANNSSGSDGEVSSGA